MPGATGGYSGRPAFADRMVGGGGGELAVRHRQTRGSAGAGLAASGTSPRMRRTISMHDAEQRQQVEEHVRRAALVAQRDLVLGRHDDHHVRRDPVRALGAVDLPVREVAHLDQHRHADLVDVERQLLLVDLDVAHLDRGQATRRRSRRPARRCRRGSSSRAASRSGSTSMRCQSSGPSSAGHRRPLVAVLEPARAELEVRSRWSPARSSTTTGCTVERHDDLGVGDLVDRPTARLSATQRRARSCSAASRLASSVRTITYRTPSACRCGTPTAASLST